MCDCLKDIIDQMKQEREDIDYVTPPTDIITGRLYLNFTIGIVGKKREKSMLLLLNKCPWCGEEYGKKAEAVMRLNDADDLKKFDQIARKEGDAL